MLSGSDDPQRLAALNALLAIAAGRKGDAANRLGRIVGDVGDVGDVGVKSADSPLAIAALESGLWLALDDNPAASYEPLQRALEGESS